MKTRCLLIAGLLTGCSHVQYIVPVVVTASDGQRAMQVQVQKIVSEQEAMEYAKTTVTTALQQQRDQRASEAKQKEGRARRGGGRTEEAG